MSQHEYTLPLLCIAVTLALCVTTHRLRLASHFKASWLGLALLHCVVMVSIVGPRYEHTYALWVVVLVLWLHNGYAMALSLERHTATQALVASDSTVEQFIGEWAAIHYWKTGHYTVPLSQALDEAPCDDMILRCVARMVHSGAPLTVVLCTSERVIAKAQSRFEACVRTNPYTDVYRPPNGSTLLLTPMQAPHGQFDVKVFYDTVPLDDAFLECRSSHTLFFVK